MPEKDWDLIETIFQQAKNLSKQEREKFLSTLDLDLESFKEVQSLLEFQNDKFLEEPAIPNLEAIEEFTDPPKDKNLPKIAGYTLIKRIGEGGMGEVYHAEQITPIKREVAIKVIRQGMDNQDVLARFEGERQALAKFNHPSIATVFDAGKTSEDKPYFAMEFVPGVPLVEYCDKNKLSIDDRLKIFIHICKGISHAHSAGVIHRDIKPANILVTEFNGEPHPKIIDFGIAKALNQKLTEDTFYTQAGQIIGTPVYMSPEQVRPNSEDIGFGADIYSLGVLLFELLTGVLPLNFSDRTNLGIDEIIQSIKNDLPDYLSSAVLKQSDENQSIVALNRNLPLSKLIKRLKGELNWIVAKCLEKEEGKRYISVPEIESELHRYINGLPILIGPPGIISSLRRLHKKNKKVVNRVGIAAFILLSCLITYLWIGFTDQLKDRRTFNDLLSSCITQVEDFKQSINNLKAEFSSYKILEKSHGKKQQIWEFEPVVFKAKEINRIYLSCLKLKNESQAKITQLTSSPMYTAGNKILNITKEIDYLSEILAKKAEDKEFKYLLNYPELRKNGSQNKEKTLIQNNSKKGQKNTKLIIKTNPAEAELFCYRIDEIEHRKIPVPLNHKFKEPYSILKIAKIIRTVPFKEGDWIKRINGSTIFTTKDFISYIKENFDKSKPIKVEITREGSLLNVDWIPFPKDSTFDVEDFNKPILDLFGFSFFGQPLSFDSRSKMGRTSKNQSYSLNLAEGDYLVVIKHPNYLEYRVPISTYSNQDSSLAKLEIIANLIKKINAPNGYIHIPKSTFYHGDDPAADTPLNEGKKWVNSFLISKNEISIQEYLKFLNSPEVIEITDPEKDEKNTTGWATPRSPIAKKALRQIKARGGGEDVYYEDGKIRLVPRFPQYWSWDRGQKKWKTTLPTDWPVTHIPQLAALEFAFWKTERARNEGKDWIYRLPTDFEWEKAARGMDKRIYVWGNFLVYSYFWNNHANPIEESRKIRPTGWITYDESIYGVLGMAGSANEWTNSVKPDNDRFISIRGGGWNKVDKFDFRIATRNGRYPYMSDANNGIRLIVDLNE